MSYRPKPDPVNLTFHGLLTSNPFGATALLDWPLRFPVSLRSLSITVVFDGLAWVFRRRITRNKIESHHSLCCKLRNYILASPQFRSQKQKTHSVPQILVPPCLLSVIREVLDSSQAGTGDAEHLTVIISTISP